MTENILIGITGRYGTGKSTLAAMLAELLDAQVVAFADALKEHTHTILEDLTGVLLPPHRIEELKSNCLGPMYQGYGEFMRQNFGQDYWIEQLESVLPARAIVADVRYPNESQWIKARGGLLVAISGPCRRDGDQRSPTHPSEAGVKECAAMADIAFENDGDLRQLRNHARAIACMAVQGAPT